MLIKVIGLVAKRVSDVSVSVSTADTTASASVSVSVLGRELINHSASVQTKWELPQGSATINPLDVASVATVSGAVKQLRKRARR